MAVIDVQVHAYERNHPGRPWVGQLHGPKSATGEEMVAAMDAVGVDAAIIVSTFNLYRYDPSYALEVYAKYPERFRVVKPIDPADPRWMMLSRTGPRPRERSASGSCCGRSRYPIPPTRA